MNDLAGKPLRYVIGKDSDDGKPGYVTEVGYDAVSLIFGIGIKYVNLFDEKNTGQLGPYLHDSDTAKEFNEGQIDPTGEGWVKNLSAQFVRATAQRFQYIELDNCDAYSVKTVVEAIDWAQSTGFKVIAKNPGNMEGDALPIVAHQGVYGIIVEKGAGSPTEMQALRLRAGKRDLPVWFVAFHSSDPEKDGRVWALSTASAIEISGLGNMGVTYDKAEKEYGGDVEDILKPIPSVLGPVILPDPVPVPAVTGADIIAKARSFKGKFVDGPDVPMLARAIGQTFPELAKYCTEATNGMPWCGDFVAYVLSLFGIRPPPVVKGIGFFLVDRWKDFGTPILVGQERPGDVAIYLGNPHHVTFVAGNGKYVGGNQHDAVTEAVFRTPDAIRRPPMPTAIPITPPPGQTRRELQQGDVGDDVRELQTLLGGIEIDGEFGPDTDAAVRQFQEASGLEIDGVAGVNTWAALLAPQKPSPPATGATGLSADTIAKITALAAGSALASYSWTDRGRAPIGYIKGMAVVFAKVLLDLKAGRSAALAMTAPIGDARHDALAHYGMSELTTRTVILRRLFALLIGLGMRESSGNYSEGRDTTAKNPTADSAEAGLFQQSWDSHGASPEFQKLMTAYSTMDGFVSIFREGVTPKAIVNVGSGAGAAFQALCKTKPAFAVEAAAICLRVLGGSAGHFGPIRRREAEVPAEANVLLSLVQAIVDTTPIVIPPTTEPPPMPPPEPVPTPTPTPVPTPTPIPPPSPPPPGLQHIDFQAIMGMVQQFLTALPAIVAQVQTIKHDIDSLRAAMPALPGLKLPVAIDPATTKPVATAPVVAVDAQNKTGLGAGILAIITALGLGATGVTGTPIGADASTTGALLPLAGAGIAALGAFGKLAPILRAILHVL